MEEEEASNSSATAAASKANDGDEKMYILKNIVDGFLHLEDPDGNIKDDVKLPEEPLGEVLEELFKDSGNVLVITLLKTINEKGEPVEVVINYLIIS